MTAPAVALLALSAPALARGPTAKSRAGPLAPGRRDLHRDSTRGRPRIPADAAPRKRAELRIPVEFCIPAVRNTAAAAAAGRNPAGDKKRKPAVQNRAEDAGMMDVYTNTGCGLFALLPGEGPEARMTP
jgi:hypothetical protein